ncbi:polyprotein [Rhynchospora pubera]|uniref:Polyprotein n=1 Tax=Rhynchospora pubera TaxID=906938 RepID=A0AAV8FYA9_9POAL|nr:polyprotein [Rhynchospora pubera]
MNSTIETAIAKFTTDALPTLFAQIRDETQRQLDATLAARDLQSKARPSTQPGDHKLRLIFPRFASGDPTDWLFNVEQYFKYYDTLPADRLLIMSMHLDSPASRWYQGLLSDHKIGSWDDFTAALQYRFGPSEFEDPVGQLSRVTQTGSVLDYQATFEELASRVRGFSSHNLMSIFIAGLQPRLRRAVQSHRPIDLHDAFSLARLHEAQIADLSYNRMTQSRQSIYTTSATKPLALEAPLVAPTQPHLPVKRLTVDEMQQRRQAGLCFNCDEKFVRGHKCKGRATLLYLEGTEDEPELEDHYSLPLTEPDQPETEISLNALLGRYSTKAMRMLGYISSHPVQVLVDSGSTNNFISRRTAQFLKLPTSPTTLFRVRVGNGAALQCNELCKEVSLSIQSHSFATDLFVLDLEGSDVVLGVQWLETLGPILTDWSKLHMEFNYKGHQIHLQGESKPNAKAISSAGLNKLITSKGVGSSYMCFTVLTPEPDNTLSPPHTIIPSLQPLLQQFQILFQIPSTLPPSRTIDHRIPLKKGIDAINVRPYRYPQFQKNEIECLVADLLQSGAIRPSQSAFSSPVLLVKKKDGTWRFCVDYRALNAATIRDRFPIPTVDELLDELHGASVFSKLDLRSGYHQIRVHAPDIHKTAFRTHHGHFEFVVMPFGLCNAPSTFQALMNEVFQPLLRKFVVIFFDDILIYSCSLEAHLQHLQQVFQILHDNQLFVKSSKCTFAASEIAFLGHIISAAGVAADPSKLSAVSTWPPPNNQRQLRSFLGLTGYYRRFVRHYASIAAPLTDLLTKDGFHWSHKEQEAFEQLKMALMTAPVLSLPDFNRPFIVETDASGVGIGAVLSQDKHPVAFYSKKLSPLMQGKSTYIREMFAIQTAVMKWRQYLLGRHFVIRTDHRSLHHMLQQTVQTPEQQQFCSKLVGYDFSIEYKPGASNAAADALSRVHESAPRPVFMSLSRPLCSALDSLQIELLSDKHTKHIIDGILTTPSSWADWTFSGGLLGYKGRLYLPSSSPLIPTLLFDYHASLLGGHSGVQRTFQRLATHFMWKGMHKSVETFVQACDICQKCKPTNHSPYGLLQPIAVPDELWADLSMDFVTHLPSSGGYTAILVVVDRFSKGIHLAPLPPHYTATKVAQVFWEIVGKLHGMPKSIISDRDPIFQSTFWKELFRLQGTKLRFSSAYHPESDGQTERMNRCVEQFLRSFVHDQPSKWARILSWAEFHHNTTFTAATGMTPFEATYGRKPPSLLAYCTGTSTIPAVDHDLASRYAIISQLKTNLAKAQEAMKISADKHRTKYEFHQGQLVLLKLQPFRQVSLRRHSSHKLSLRYYGPYC